MHGFVLIDKPAGPSSFTIAAAVRRALDGKPKTGHGGTLDPFATGLMVVLVGNGTRLMPWVVGHDKRYELTVQLGAASTTDDIAGELTVVDGTIAWDRLDASIEELRCATRQIPPQVSALHVDGERAYNRVRRGETLELAARDVRFDAIDLVSVDRDAGTIQLDVKCSRGTYMRSLARDLGEALGSAGYAAALRRSAIGEWSVHNAVVLGDVSSTTVLPLADLVPELPRLELDPSHARRFLHGQRIALEPSSIAAGIVAVLHRNVLIGIAAVDDEYVLRPRAVLAPAGSIAETAPA